MRKYFLKEKYQNQTLGQYFVVGISKDHEKFQKIKDEAFKYDDIIIGVGAVMPWTYFPPFQYVGRQGATRESISHEVLLTEH